MNLGTVILYGLVIATYITVGTGACAVLTNLSIPTPLPFIVGIAITLVGGALSINWFADHGVGDE